MGRGLSWGQRGESGCVPTGFRYARRSDEPKAENTRGEALLFSWSHLHGIYSPAWHTACLPSLAKPEFADQHLLTQGVSDRARVLLYSGKICALSAVRFVHSQQFLPGSQSYRLHLTILESIKRPYLRYLQALTIHFRLPD